MIDNGLEFVQHVHECQIVLLNRGDHGNTKFRIFHTMKSSPRRKTAIFILVTACLVLAAGTRLYLYLLGGKYIPATSDEAITALQALDILDGRLPLLMAAQPYLFPMEAYWMAPLVNFIPRTPAGLRVLVALEGLVFTVLSLMIMRKMGTFRDLWPCCLLILFPSTYILMNQTAYSLPGYNSAFILSLLAVWLIFQLNSTYKRRDGAIAFAGAMCASLAFTNGMFALSFMAPLGVLAFFRARGNFPRLAGLVIGGLAGLAPYVAAKIMLPGSYNAVTQRHTIAEALARIWNPALSHTLPVTFGWKPCYFPDNAELIYWGVWGYRVFPYVFSIILITGCVLAIYRLWTRFQSSRQFVPGILEWSVATTIMSIIIFVFSQRADSASYRYLAPIAVAFPFLAAGVLLQVRHSFRRILVSLVVLLAMYNLVTAFRITKEWKLEYFGPLAMSAPDVMPAINYLRERGIHHAVASYWAAYRITFRADGDVICSQPLNERFPGWPLPYKDTVDAATNVAYVLTDKISHLKPKYFERHLQTMNVEAQVHTAGHFKVYHDFRAVGYGRKDPLNRSFISVTASETADKSLSLIDLDPTTYWRSDTFQNSNLWVEFSFDAPVEIVRMVIGYGSYAHDQPPAIAIRYFSRGEWMDWNREVHADIDKFAWENGHPVYGRSQQTFLLRTEAVEKIRIQIVNPNPIRDWTIADVRFYEAIEQN